jgi:hypothetical protein
MQVTELWQFFVLRMLTGVAVGGCFPLVFSLLGDLFPVSQRSAMAALVQVAVGGGIAGGQVRQRQLQRIWQQQQQQQQRVSHTLLPVGSCAGSCYSDSIRYT